MMIETLTRICELQPTYDPTNTPSMQERGILIRQTLTSEVSALSPLLRTALGEFGNDFGIGASDGIGRKTEAPWVRFFATSMSPDPRHGFYAVLHFAADGSAVFVTVGCGATTWANGELRAFSDDELQRKTDWARKVIVDRFGSLVPFVDKIALGAKAPLPRAFEKATAFAKRIAVDQLEQGEFIDLLTQAAERLKEIYEAQRVGADLTVSEIAQVELEQIARLPRSGKTTGGQGFRLSQDERVAIEIRAMDLSREWLQENGFSVTDTSKTSPFDFLATKENNVLKVEVKGTTAVEVESIFMTKNEVTLHRTEKGSTALLIVSKIRLDRSSGVIVASHGEVTPFVAWDIDSWDAVPIAYQLRKKI